MASGVEAAAAHMMQIAECSFLLNYKTLDCCRNRYCATYRARIQDPSNPSFRRENKCHSTTNDVRYDRNKDQMDVNRLWLEAINSRDNSI
jgi:hypothetical protein